tara:strand:+ start:55 stop:600 length:546 start_codon:yes stop_codon:yes gene_type:complete
MERNVVYIAVFAALIAVLGLLPKLTLISGIPITAQSLGIMLCGTILGAKRGALAVLLFLALVALGLPLLAGGRGGLGVFTTPWAGFLFGFPVAAFVAGLMMECTSGMNVGVLATIAAILGGIVTLYAIAIPYYMVGADVDLWAAMVTMSPFMPGDLIKTVLAGVITGGLYRARPDAVLSRA